MSLDYKWIIYLTLYFTSTRPNRMFSNPDSAASGSTSLIGNSLLDVQILGSSSDPSAHCSTPSHRSLTWIQSRLNSIRHGDIKILFIQTLKKSIQE